MCELLFSYKVFALNIDLKKIDGVESFVISNLDANYKISTQKKFVKIQILGKKAKNQFYKQLNNNYFDFISLFNVLNHVDIVISAKDGYEIVSKKEQNTLIIQPKKTMQEKQTTLQQNYVDSSLFVKPNFNIDLIQTKPTAQNIFFSGLGAYSQKNYQAAIPEFIKLTNNSNNEFFLNALYLLASSYEKLGDYDKSIKIYHEILNYSLELDAPGKIMYKIAKIYKKQNDSRYLDILKKLVEEYPYSDYADKAKFELGDAFFKDKNYNKAVLYYSSITKENSLYKIGMLRAGYIFYLEQNYPQAAYLFYLVNFNNLDIKNNEKYIASAAYVFCRMKDFKSANSVFSFIKNTQSTDFYIAKAECDFMENKPQAAQNTVNEAIKAFPNNDQVKMEKAKIDLLTKSLSEKEIENIANQYKNNNEISPLALWSLARIYYNQKDYLKVLNLYSKIINSSSSILDNFKNLAQDSLNKYASESAQNLNEKSMYNAVKLSKNLKLNLNSCNLARGFMYLGQYAYAFDSLDKVSECYRIIKANYEIQKGNIKNAMQNLNSIKDQDYINMIFARISYANGDYNKSKAFFEKCLKSKDELLKQFAQLQIAKINIDQNVQSKPINDKNFKAVFLRESEFLNGLYYFNKKDYTNALKNLEKVENYKKYSEQAYFYETLCLINMGQKSLALKKLSILEHNYPDSTLSKKLKILLQ
ncbi:MAG: tetratricopeptide repeat protein [Desulfurella sp.]